MIEWDAARIAAAAGAQVVGGEEREPADETEQSAQVAGIGAAGGTAGDGPSRAVIDSRLVQPGDLFIGLRGDRVDGGAYAEQALRAGAWGVLVASEHAQALAEIGVVLTHPAPLAGMQSLARAWRRALGEAGAKVVGITGSTGKTSTKDILATLLRNAREQLSGGTAVSEANLNTEIGLPLTVLAAPLGTKALVLEMAMRGAGQIAELTAIAQPDVGVIVNVGPVHLEQLGTLAAVAGAKAELIAGMASGTTAIVPAGEPLLEPHLRADLRTVRFGAGGDVELVESAESGEVTIVDHTSGGQRIMLRPSFAQSHNLRNLLAAVAAARALGVTPEGALEVEFSALRGERIALAEGIVLINDCYNANPMSMRAALDELAVSAGERKVAVLGDMLELGAEERRLHREIGAYARARGVELLVTVGPLAAEMGEEEGGAVYSVVDAAEAATLLGGLLRAGDTVLVKGSRGVGLERVAQMLLAEAGAEAGAEVKARAEAGSTAPAPGGGD